MFLTQHWRAKRRRRRRKKEESGVQESVELKSLHYCKEPELVAVARESSPNQLSTVWKRVCQVSEEVVQNESSSYSNQTDSTHKQQL